MRDEENPLHRDSSQRRHLEPSRKRHGGGAANFLLYRIPYGQFAKVSMAVVSRDSFRGRQTVSAELAQIRVLTVDNHALVREGIAVVLDSESYMRVMAEASKMAVEIAEHQAGDALTDLEVQVLKEVADGDANKIVADRLAI